MSDRIIFRDELCALLHVGSECIRRWIKTGKLPEPDIAITQRTKAWKLSTLEQAGIKLV